ncbi:MAG: hypothetical protein ABIH66_13390 [bacterium]
MSENTGHFGTDGEVKQPDPAENKAAASKIMFWIIGLLVIVAAFAYFVWPTPWRTYVQKPGTGMIVITKYNRITGSTCTIILRLGDKDIRGSCW